MIERLESIAKEVCKLKGVALYDVEAKSTQKGMVFIVYISKMGGVTISDCQSVSRAIDDMFTAEYEDEGKFFLEVSSPGLERYLKTQNHFAGAINEKIKIKFKFEDDYKNVDAVLKEVQSDFIVIEADEVEYKVIYDDIKKAKTNFDYKKGEQKK